MRARGAGINATSRRRSRRLQVAGTGLAVAALAVHQLWRHGLEVRSWDYMFVSGSLATLAGLWLSTLLPERFELMVSRLGDRRALMLGDSPLTQSEIESLRAFLRDRARKISVVTSLLLGTGIGIAWAVVALAGDAAGRSFDAYAGPVVGAIGGALVGWALGRMLAAGLLAAALDRKRITLEVTPAHPDGAAGLKPLGDYYLFQALLLAFPAAYLAAWSLLMLLGVTDRYERWLEPYLALVALAIGLELVAFALPLWSVHRVMTTQRRSRLAVADQKLGARIADLHRQLEAELSPAQRRQLNEQLDELSARYRDAETMPTWPLDQSLRRRLTLGNLVLLVPLIGQVVKLAQ